MAEASTPSPTPENLEKVKTSLPEGVKLIAVSKTHPPEMVMEAYNAGQRVFGENKAQELKDKEPLLPDDIEWHFIGHLQTNKVKYIAPFVHLIHSIDTIKLLNEVNKRAAQNDRVIDCLLQLAIAEEETKFGLSFEQARTLLHPDRTKEEFDNIRIVGLMGMATHTDDTEKIRREFRSIKRFFDEMKAGYCKDKPHFKELSIGMTNDYPIAIEEGGTLIRVGSAIFGGRSYSK